MIVKRSRETLWFLGVIFAPFVGPAISYFLRSEDSLLGMAIALFGPFFYVVIGLFAFWVAIPRSWRESSTNQIKGLFRKYHALEAAALFFLAIFQIAVASYMGDPWLQNSQFHLIVIALYALYVVPALSARHFFRKLEVINSV